MSSLCLITSTNRELTTSWVSLIHNHTIMVDQLLFASGWNFLTTLLEEKTGLSWAGFQLFPKWNAKHRFTQCQSLKRFRNFLFWGPTSQIQFRSIMSNSLWPHGLQHAKLPCPSPTPGACSSSCPSNQWCHPTISSSVIPLSFCLQSLRGLGSFLMSQFFTSDGQSIGASTSASVLPINPQDWLPLRLTGLISLQSKGLSRVFSNTTVQKHQFFGTQLSLWYNSHIHTWILEKS